MIGITLSYFVIVLESSLGDTYCMAWTTLGWRLMPK